MKMLIAMMLFVPVVCFAAEPAPAATGWLDWLKANAATIFGVWVLIEQILAQVTSIKENSVFQLVCRIVDAVFDLLIPKKKDEVTE